MRRRGRAGAAVGAALVLTAAGLVGGVIAPAGAAAACSGRAGDTDGDKRSDPVVGVPGKHAGQGQIDLFSASTTGMHPTGFLRPGIDGVPGDAKAGTLFGRHIEYGDVNGDGCSDIAVDATEDPTPSIGGSREFGSVTVFLGRAGRGITRTGAQLVSATTLGLAAPTVPHATGQITRTISNPVLGDFRGTGRDDLVVLETTFDENRAHATADLLLIPTTAHGLDLTSPERIDATDLRSGPDGTFIGGDVELAAGPVYRGQHGLEDLAVGVGGGGGGTGAAVHGDVAQHPVVDVLAGGSHFPENGGTQRWDLESAGVPGTDLVGVVAPVSLAFGDYNGDGAADLAFGLPRQNHVAVLYSNGAALAAKGAQGFAPGEKGVKGPTGDIAWGQTLAAGDFNADGDDELVVGVGDGSIAVLPGTHAHGITDVGDLRWSQSTPGVPGTRQPNTAFSLAISTAALGRGRADDLIVADSSAGGGAGSVTELFGSTGGFNVGLTTEHATVITEDTPGVPGYAKPGDAFSGL